MKKQNILVVGLGPCGGIIAAHLAAAGHVLYGIDASKKHVAGIRRGGLRVENRVSLCTRLHGLATGLGEMAAVDIAYAVIAVKTPHLRQVLTDLQRIPGDFRIVLAQNGIDVEDLAAEYFPAGRILRMVLYYGGTIVSPGLVRMNFFQEPNYVGCLCGREGCGHADEFARLMTDSGLRTNAVADIKKYAWEKGILNAVLAPIAAVLGANMAEVMNIAAVRGLVEALLQESVQVGRAAGHDFARDFPAQCLSFLLQAGHHRPSMLNDLQNGDMTEIDHINGRIVDYAKRLGVPAPLNAALTALIKARERLAASARSERCKK